MTWLDPVFGRTTARRVLIAFACSIALHELLAGLLPGRPSEEPVRETVAHVTIARIERTAQPTPSPTPPPAHAISLTPEGKAARREAIVHEGAPRPKPPHSIVATPDTYVPTGAQGAGAGAGSGAGSIADGSGGTGEGEAGNGGGAAPCGEVDFQSLGDAAYDAATGRYERSNIIATVHYTDGTSERLRLDWTWSWPSEADDPFKNLEAPTYFQFPPASQRASEPALVHYIMRYTTAAGATNLRDCPNAAPDARPTGNA
jgi:hypothetical protein